MIRIFTNQKFTTNIAKNQCEYATCISIEGEDIGHSVSSNVDSIAELDGMKKILRHTENSNESQFSMETISNREFLPNSFIEKTNKMYSKNLSQGILRTGFLGIIIFFISILNSFAADVDLRLTQSIDNSVPQLGDNITYTYYLVNEGATSATNIGVQAQMPLGAVVNITTNANDGTAGYNSGTGIVNWTVASLTAGDSVRLEISGDVTARGVFFSIGEIISSDDVDVDSSPGNSSLTEDDIATACFSVPLFLYPGDEYTVSVPAPYSFGTGITWYRDGVEITGSTTGATVNPDNTLTIASVGDYTFTTNISTCPATGCCAIQIIPGPYGSIGDFVWEDSNEDGLQQTSEPKIGGMSVELLNGSGNVIASTMTDINGFYEFDSLLDGDYRVKFILPATAEFTPPFNPANLALNSDAGADSLSGVVTISIFDANGITRDSSDINRFNSTIDAGIIQVLDFDLALTTTLSTTGPIYPGQTISFDVTVFNQGVLNATFVKIVNYIPPGLTLVNGQGWIADGNIARYTANLSIAAGANTVIPISFTVNAGTAGTLFNAAEISETKGPSGQNITDIDSTPDEDPNNDGTIIEDEINQDGKNGGDEDDSDIAEAFIGDQTQIGDYVWEDLNANGVNEVGEPPMAGVIVELLNGSGLSVAKDTTDANGSYLFTNLTPGTYALRFLASSLPSGFSFTVNNNGTDDNDDSDVDPITGETTPTTLGAGESDLSWDAGVYQKASIGDYVWEDTDEDGVQGASEVFMAGVPVTLQRPNGDFVASTLSDPNGKYLFDDLTPGDYVVVFGKPNGFKPTQANSANGNSDNDSNADVTTGESEIISLISGEANNSVDAGFTAEQCESITSIQADNTEICVGDNANLVATASSGSDINWYFSSTGGAILTTTQSGANYTVNPTTTTTYYAELVTADANCPNDRVPLTVIVNARPSNPSTISSVDVCTGETTDLNALNIGSITTSGGTFEWHTGSLPTSPIVANPSTAGAGTYYLFERSGLGCYSNPAIVNVVGKSCQETIDLSLVKIADKRKVEVDDIVTFTITVSNTGPDVATNVVIEDILPNGLEFLNSATLSHNSDTLSATITAIAVNQTITLVYQTRATTIGTLINVAQVIAADQVDADSTPGNGEFVNEDDDDDEVLNVTAPTQIADLRLSKIVSDNTPEVGDLVNYTISITNDGPETATNVEVQDVIPFGLTYESATGSDGISRSGSIVNARFNQILSGQTVEFEVLTTVNGSGSITNTAQVTKSDQTDPDSTPNAGFNEDDDDAVTITVVNPCNPSTPNISSANPYICVGETTTITALNCNGTVVWSNGQTGNAINVSPTSSTIYTAECQVGTCFSNESNPIAIIVNTVAPPSIAANKTTACAGEAINLTATGCSGTVTWSSGQTGASITVNPTVTTTYTAVCETVPCTSNSSIPVTINVIANLAPPVIAANNNTICTGESVTISASNCTGTVTWSNGAVGTSINVSPTTATSYTATCSSGTCNSGVSNTVSINVNQGSKPILSVAKTNICEGESVTITSNNCPTGIAWSNGATGNSITVSPLATTIYTATCGGSTCAGSSSVTITVAPKPAPPVVTYVGDSICAGETVTFTGNDCDGTVTWSNGATGTSIVVNPVATTTYTSTCTENGCVSDPSIPVTIVVLTETPSITATKEEICGGESATLTAGACSGSLEWNTGSTLASIVVSPTVSTTYSVTCTANGCEGTSSITINVNNGAIPVIVASSLNICNADTVTLTVTNCTQQVNWSTGQSGASIQVNPLVTTSYTATCGISTCAGSEVVTVVVGAGAPPTITASTETICGNGSATLTAANCSGNLTWSTGDTTASITVSPTATTDYTVTCVFGSCTSSATKTITITNGENPTLRASNDEICAGQSVTITATGCSSNLNWSTGDTGTSITVSPTDTTTYSVVCSNGGSCQGSDAITINVKTGGVLPIVADTNNVCANTEVILSATACSDSIIWNTGAIGDSIVVSPLTTTTYSATCGTGTCASSGSITVNVREVQKPTVVAISNTCPTTTVDLSDAITSSISSQGGSFVFRTGNSPDSTVVTGITEIASSGTFYAFELAGNGCFSEGSSIVITIDSCNTNTDCIANPAIAIAGNDTTICLGNGVFNLNGIIGGSAQSGTWSSSGSGVFEDSSSLNTTYRFSYDDIVAGVVSLTLTTNDPDGNGPCVAADSTIDITINAIKVLPIITSNIPPNICTGDSVVLTVSQTSDAYLWSTGDTTKSIVVKTPGDYTVRLINASGCSSFRSEVFNVNLNSGIVAPTVNNLATNVCPDTTVDLTTQILSSPVEVDGAFEIHTGISPTSDLVLDLSAATEGDYYVFEKSASGCYSTPSQIKVIIDDCQVTGGTADVAIVIVGDDNSVAKGEDVVYTITVTNNGPVTATNIRVENTLPNGITLSGGTPNLIQVGNKLIGTIPSLAVGESVVYTYTAILNKAGLVSNIAQITRLDQNDPILSNNTSQFDVECSTCQETCIATALRADTTRLANGTWNIRFTSLVENCGNVDFTEVELKDDFSTMFPSPTTFTIVEQPSVNGTSNLTPNPAYNGRSDINLLIPSSSEMASGTIDTVTWVINLIPNGSVGPFNTNTVAKGSGLDIFGFTSESSDVSNDGSIIVKPSGTPTVVRLYDSPSIGLALAISDTTKLPNGTFDVTYKATVKNNGSLPLNNVVLYDTLANTYLSPASYTMISIKNVDENSTLIVNQDFNGNDKPTLTLPSSTMLPGQVDTICFVINVDPADIIEFDNNALVEGTGTLANSTVETVEDVSNVGYNPDAPGSAPTTLIITDDNTNSTQNPCIGVALYVADSSRKANGSYDITYHAIIQNCGNTNLTQITMCDTLALTFMDPSVATVVGTPSTGLGSTLQIDNTFDGVNNTCILNPAGSTLAPNKIDTVKWTVNLVLNSNNGPFRNNVLVTGTTATNEIVSDLSNNGIDPNPIGSTPTVLNFNILKDELIGLAKEVEEIKSIGNGKYEVIFNFIVKNYGIVDFERVQIQDNLAATFGNKVIIDSTKVIETSTNFTANPIFTGKGQLIDMLVDTSSVLPVYGSGFVKLWTRVDVSQADSSIFENMALAVGYTTTSSTDDQSTEGLDPDPEADGTPENNTIPTRIDFGTVQDTTAAPFTPLGIAKAVSDTAAIVDGSYQVEYTVIVRNFGTRRLEKVTLTDSLTQVFSDSTDFSIIGIPTLSAGSELVLNSEFDGVLDFNILADSSALAVGRSDTITFKVKVRNNASTSQTYSNTIYGTAQDSTTIVRDLSNEGLLADQNGNNNPGDDNEPTLVTLRGKVDTDTSRIDIIIPGGLSPNDDGINDNLIIRGIFESDSVAMKIYNRWGHLVFATTNYKSDFPGDTDGWNGIANQGIRIDNKGITVPDGTYFYCIESPNKRLFDGKAYYNFLTIAGGRKE